MARSSELGTFLQAQRTRVRPADVDLVPDGVPRRVPGLRREEVARLAGVSTDYYTRLEQGRKLAPSEAVLESVARALRLDGAARQHLFDLSRVSSSRRAPRVRPVQRVRPGTQVMIDSWTDSAALVLGRRSDVLAMNALGRNLIVDFDAMPAVDRNYTRWVLLDARAREVYPDWEVVASDMVALLRLEAGRRPGDRGISDLVGELSVRSPEFASWWADHRVSAHHHGTKRFRHPLVGELDLDWQGLVLPGDEDQTVYTYFAPAGSSAAEALRLIASWNAPQGADTGRTSSRLPPG